MGRIYREFRQEDFQLNLHQYLKLVNQKICFNLLLNLFALLIFGGGAVACWLLDIKYNLPRNFSGYQVGFIIAVILGLWFLLMIIWWLNLVFKISYLNKNLTKVPKWSFKKKKKYLTTFVWSAKACFSTNSVSDEIQQTITKFKNRFPVNQTKKEKIYSALDSWVDLPWFYIDDEYGLMVIIGAIALFYLSRFIYFLPMTWTQIKYQRNFRNRWIENLIIQKNFSLINNEFCQTLEI